MATQQKRPVAGEYGEGAAHESTGVGPRNPDAGEQRLDDRPGYPDPYGTVEPGRYGAHGYSGSPAHPSAYAPESGVPGAAAAQAQRNAGEHGQIDLLAEDQRLRERILERLTQDPDIDAGDVSIQVHAGVVTLAGRVPSARMVEVVQQTVENCGARAVRSHLTVG